MTRAYVLLSGGIDSNTCMAVALEEFDDVHAVSIDYGQRHHKEIDFAKEYCDHLQIPHKILDLKSIVPKTMLTDKDAEVPNISYDEIEGVSPTYVPFRNGLMLSALTSYVHGKYEEAVKELHDLPDGVLPNTVSPLGEWGIYFGAHAEDAQNWAYPDCTPEFIGAMANAIFIGSYQSIRLRTPLMSMIKSDILLLGTKLGVDYSRTWSCYKGEDKHCGTCPTCRARKKAFWDSGLKDPTEYTK